MFIPTWGLTDDDKKILRKWVAELLENGESLAIEIDDDGFGMRLSFRSQQPVAKIVGSNGGAADVNNAKHSRT